MAKPSSKEDLKEYALRKLGKPVLEINVDDDQIDDLIDDAIQLYHERHGEGIDSEGFYLINKILFHITKYFGELTWRGCGKTQ